MAKPEHLAVIRQGKDAAEEWLRLATDKLAQAAKTAPRTAKGRLLMEEDPYATRFDLRGADLQGMRLTGFDLSQADLKRANLAHADLSGANLTVAELHA